MSSLAFSDEFLNAFNDSDRGQKVFLVGSAISSYGETKLPQWGDFVDSLLESLAELSLGSSIEIAKDTENTESIVSNFTTFLKNIITSIKDERKAQISKHYESNPSRSFCYLEDYHITDLLTRRLGEKYLEVLCVFEKAEPNNLHKELIKQIATFRHEGTQALGVITTNFDRCLDRAIEQKENVELIEISGEFTKDIKILEEKAEEWKDDESIVIFICQSFNSFRTIASWSTFFLPGERFRFVYNVHGTAKYPRTCIDSNFQRQQKLPYGLAQSLRNIYATSSLCTAGYSGMDLHENLDYLLMESNADQIQLFWGVQNPDKPGTTLNRLKDVFEDRRSNQNTPSCILEIGQGSFSGAVRKGGDLVEVKKDIFEKIKEICGNSRELASCCLLDIIYALKTELKELNDLDSADDEYYSQLQTVIKGWEEKLMKNFMKKDFQKSINSRSTLYKSYISSITYKVPEGKISNIMVFELFSKVISRIKKNIQENKRIDESIIKEISKLFTKRQRIEFCPDLWVLWTLVAAVYFYLDSNKLSLKRKLAQKLQVAERYYPQVKMTYYNDMANKFFIKAWNEAEQAGNVWARRILLTLRGSFFHPIDNFLAHSALSSKEAYRLFSSIKKRNIEISGFLYVLGFDNVVPARFTDTIALPEYYRGLLCAALLLSRKIVLGDQFLLNSRVFLLEVLERINCTSSDRVLGLILDDEKRKQSMISVLKCCNLQIFDLTGTTDVQKRREQMNNPKFKAEKIPNKSINRVFSIYQEIEGSGCSISKGSASDKFYSKTPYSTNIKGRDIGGNYKIGTQNLLSEEKRGDLINHLAYYLKDIFKEEDMRKHIKKAIEIFKKLFEAVISSNQTWVRSIPYTYFRLSAETGGERSLSEQSWYEGNLIENRNHYLRYFWRYNEIMTLLASAPYLLNIPITFKYDVLATNLWEKTLTELGSIAFKRKIIEKRVQDLKWPVIQALNPTDLANKKLKLYKDNPSYTLRELLNEVANTPKGFQITTSSKLDPDEAKKYLLETIEKLEDEYVLCNGSPIPRNYRDPDLEAVVYQFRESKN